MRDCDTREVFDFKKNKYWYYLGDTFLNIQHAHTYTYIHTRARSRTHARIGARTHEEEKTLQKATYQKHVSRWCMSIWGIWMERKTRTQRGEHISKKSYSKNLRQIPPPKKQKWTVPWQEGNCYWVSCPCVRNFRQTPLSKVSRGVIVRLAWGCWFRRCQTTHHSYSENTGSIIYSKKHTENVCLQFHVCCFFGLSADNPFSRGPRR